MFPSPVTPCTEYFLSFFFFTIVSSWFNTSTRYQYNVTLPFIWFFGCFFQHSRLNWYRKGAYCGWFQVHVNWELIPTSIAYVILNKLTNLFNARAQFSHFLSQMFPHNTTSVCLSLRPWTSDNSLLFTPPPLHVISSFHVKYPSIIMSSPLPLRPYFSQPSCGLLLRNLWFWRERILPARAEYEAPYSYSLHRRSTASDRSDCLNTDDTQVLISWHLSAFFFAKILILPYGLIKKVNMVTSDVIPPIQPKSITASRESLQEGQSVNLLYNACHLGGNK